MTSRYPAILGLGSYLPGPSMSAQNAIAAGYCQASDLAKGDFQSVQVEDRLYPADMAEVAARQALHGRTANELDWLLYSHIHYQGQPRLWSPASYLQHRLAAPQAQAINTVQGCNGMLLSLELACRLLHGSPGRSALCLSADRFNISGFQRWRADYGLVYGDAAAAALLGYADDAIADILAIESLAAPELEGLHRHTHPAPEGSFDPDDIRSSKKRYLVEHGATALQDATRRSLHSLWQRVAQRSGVSRHDIGHLLLPHLGRQLLADNYLAALDLPRAQTNIEAGLQLGHLGCADPLLSLHQLQQGGHASGELALLVGAGAGFSWTLCLVSLR